MWCGSDRPRAINRWAENRREWLEQFLSLANRNSLARLYSSSVDGAPAKVLPHCFQDWIAHLIQNDDSGPDGLIAIDDKTCWRSDNASPPLGPLHIASAWASRKGSPWARERPRRNPT